MTDQTTIEQIRLTAAQAEFESYDFGCPMESCDGWEWTTPGGEISKVVYLEGDGDSIKGHFTVHFDENSFEPIEAYCMVNGNYQGRVTPR